MMNRMSRNVTLPVQSLELQFGLAEIYQERDVVTSCSEVIDHLCLVFRPQRLYGLDFDQHLAVNDYIGVENTNVFITEYDLKKLRQLQCKVA